MNSQRNAYSFFAPHQNRMVTSSSETFHAVITNCEGSCGWTIWAAISGLRLPRFLIAEAASWGAAVGGIDTVTNSGKDVSVLGMVLFGALSHPEFIDRKILCEKTIRINMDCSESAYPGIVCRAVQFRRVKFWEEKTVIEIVKFFFAIIR